MFQEIRVWKRTTSGQLILYRCFQSLSTKKYYVQSADFYEKSVKSAHISQRDLLFLELLSDLSPEERTEGFATLEEAIQAHDADFAN